MKKKEKELPVKPNGEQLGDFIISIDDGFVEYSYRISLDSGRTIRSIQNDIKKLYKKRKMETIGIRKSAKDIVKEILDKIDERC